MQAAEASVTAQLNGAEIEMIDRKRRRKLTKRKKMDLCMESQPLASANQADAETQAQCMAAGGLRTGASDAHCEMAPTAGDALQAGPVPSSADAAQDDAQLQRKAANNVLQVQARLVLNHDHEEGLLVASEAFPNQDLGLEAVHVKNVAEGIGSQDETLAAVPPSDDEAEVCTSG